MRVLDFMLFLQEVSAIGTDEWVDTVVAIELHDLERASGVAIEIPVPACRRECDLDRGLGVELREKLDELLGGHCSSLPRYSTTRQTGYTGSGQFRRCVVPEDTGVGAVIVLFLEDVIRDLTEKICTLIGVSARLQELRDEHVDVATESCEVHNQASRRQERVSSIHQSSLNASARPIMVAISSIVSYPTTLQTSEISTGKTDMLR